MKQYVVCSANRFEAAWLQMVKEPKLEMKNTRCKKKKKKLI